MSLKHVAEGGTLSEEVISTVRTAQAFGTQKIHSEQYNAHMSQSERAELKSAMWNGAGVGVFFFILYSAYGLGKCLYFLLCQFRTTD